MKSAETCEMLTDVLLHPLFERARRATGGNLSAQEILQMTKEEKRISLYLIKIGRLINEYEHNHKSTICSNP